MTIFFISKRIFGFIFEPSWSYWYYLDILLYFSLVLNMFSHTSKHMFNNFIIWRTWESNQSVGCSGCQCISMSFFFFFLGGELTFSGALSSGVLCGLGGGCDCPDIYFYQGMMGWAPLFPFILWLWVYWTTKETCIWTRNSTESKPKFSPFGEWGELVVVLLTVHRFCFCSILSLWHSPLRILALRDRSFLVCSSLRCSHLVVKTRSP